MKKTIILHIGLPKTGTTYLQCQIQANRDKFKSKGIYVPKTGQLVGRDHNLLALVMQPERWNQFPADISTSLSGLWDRFLEEIDHCGCPTILVTSEAFSWELKTTDQIKSVRDYLVDYDVKIVFCERDPYDFIPSIYGQLIRTGRGPYKLDSFLREFSYFWSTAFQKERWETFFGTGNFMVLSYTELRGEEILSKFLNAVFPDHGILSEQFDLSEDVNPNLSFSPRFLRFLEELSSNQIDTTPYINLHLNVSNTIVPLEHQIVTPLEIDEALKRCGMEIDYPNSTSRKLLQNRGQQEKDQLKEELNEIKSLLKKSFDLINITEMRSRTIEYVLNQNSNAEKYQIDQLQNFYVDWMSTMVDLNQRPAFNASNSIELKTDYPIALESHDHNSPDSTMEGIPRPIFFVQNCISVLGQDIKCLDLGTGAAGLVYEYAMSGVLAVGVDGSNFCRVNRIGYWPLLPHNLFTCDITKPFSLLSRDAHTQIEFNVITMWEVLEHIAEKDLNCLFSNISRHLGKDGYFIGSVSLLEYTDNVGNKYHVTLKERDWWKEKFFENGLTVLDKHPFNEKLFCRGNGPRFQDFHNYELDPKAGFNFVAQRFSDL